MLLHAYTQTREVMELNCCNLLLKTHYAEMSSLFTQTNSISNCSRLLLIIHPLMNSSRAAYQKKVYHIDNQELGRHWKTESLFNEQVM